MNTTGTDLPRVSVIRKKSRLVLVASVVTCSLIFLLWQPTDLRQYHHQSFPLASDERAPADASNGKSTIAKTAAPTSVTLETTPTREPAKIMPRVKWNENASSSSLRPEDGLADLRGHIPEWAQEYLEWHVQQRAKFPDLELIHHPDAPSLLIKYCLKNCGGLHDRLGSLGTVLYAAYRSRRVLLLRWFTPHPLEIFLVPQWINWTVPHVPEWYRRADFLQHTTDFGAGWTASSKRYPNKYNNNHNNSNNNDTSSETTYRNVLDAAVRSPQQQAQKVLSLQYWGNGPRINLTLEVEVEAAERHSTVHPLDSLPDTAVATTTILTKVTASPFGHVWHALFRPSPPVQAMLDETQRALTSRRRDDRDGDGGYDDDSYYWFDAAMHCRVRHPGRYAPGQNPDGKKRGTSADMSGLPFVGENRKGAIATALHALQCTNELLTEHDGGYTSSTQPRKDTTKSVYFLSDSAELVAYMADRMVGHNHNQSKTQGNEGDDMDRLVQQVRSNGETSRLQVVSRDVVRIPSTHIGRETKVPKRTHQATIVDLYLAIHSRCLAFGVGNFAYLAAKISGTSCLIRHEEYGNRNMDHDGNATTTTKPKNYNNNWFNQQTKGARLCERSFA